jgi:hypothetical protein
MAKVFKPGGKPGPKTPQKPGGVTQKPGGGSY